MSTCIGQICGENRLGAMDIFVVCWRQCKETENSKGKRERAEGMQPFFFFFFLFLKAPSFGLHSERFSAALSCNWICCICLKPWTLTSLYNFRVQMELHSYLAAQATMLCYAFSVNSRCLVYMQYWIKRLWLQAVEKVYHVQLSVTYILWICWFSSGRYFVNFITVSAVKRYGEMQSPLSLSLACERFHFHRQARELWNAHTLSLEFTVLWRSGFENS